MSTELKGMMQKNMWSRKKSVNFDRAHTDITQADYINLSGTETSESIPRW